MNENGLANIMQHRKRITLTWTETPQISVPSYLKSIMKNNLVEFENISNAFKNRFNCGISIEMFQ